MKKGWEIKKLGEVLKVQNGYAFNSKLFTIEAGTPLIRIRDIKNGIRTETNFNGTYDKKYEVKSGDFLIGMDGEFGCYEWKGDTSLLNQRVCRLQDFSNKLHPRFLFYGINKYLKAIEEVTAYATVKHISSKQIEAIEIPLPSLTEQQRIVSILDEAFAAIAKAKANAVQNLKNAKELFESYLQEVFERGGDGWVQKTLGQLCVFTQGIQRDVKLQSETAEENQVRFLRIVDYTQGNELPRYIDFPGEKYILNTDDVALVRYGASTGFVCRGLEGALANNLFRVIPKSKEKLTNDFLFIYLESRIFQNVIKATMNGAAMPAISFGLIEEIAFPLPPLQEQQNIVRQFNKVSAESQRLEALYQKKIENLEELKKSILQKAFAGDLS